MSDKRTIYRGRWGKDPKAIEAGKEGRWVMLKGETYEQAYADLISRAAADGCKLGQIWCQEVAS